VSRTWRRRRRPVRPRRRGRILRSASAV